MTAEPRRARVDERAVARVLDAMRRGEPLILLRRTRSGWYQVAVLAPQDDSEDASGAA